jgi:hypothetical protein
VADVAACLAGRSSASKLRAHSLKAKAQSSFHRDKIGLARPVVDPVPGVPVDQFDRFLVFSSTMAGIIPMIPYGFRGWPEQARVPRGHDHGQHRSHDRTTRRQTRDKARVKKTRLNAASPQRGPRGTVISQFAGDAHPVYYFSTSDQTPFQLVHGAVVRN